MTAPSLFGDSETTSDSARESMDVSPRHDMDQRTGPTASLYRKYRPQSFADHELVGQDHVVRTLRNAVSLDRVAHAYLFSGPRGTGKTTTARLLAKAVNCLATQPDHRPCNACPHCVAINAGSSPDIIEIDAASNRGIDDIRDLRDRVRYAPAQLRSKVYIIDEAHQITGAAANAFLKTLEEPPAHTRFILATTDPEELLPTIVSRCQRFEFRRVSAENIVRRLRAVADEEGIQITDDALRAIARHATGSLRDALGLLEQLALLAGTPAGASGLAAIDASDVHAALGLSRNDRVESLVDALSRRSPGAALGIVQAAVDDGEDPRQLNRQLIAYLRLLMLERSGSVSDADDRARELAAAFSVAELAALARRFGDIDFSIKHAPYPQLPLEVALVESAAAIVAGAFAHHSNDTTARVASPNIQQPTPLRDRVRGQSPPFGARSPAPAGAERVSPAPITPLRGPAASAAEDNADVALAQSFDVERIVDLWPNVRADVKALNRRIEALLSEVDPVAVSGNQITLAVPYPFHRDKLNSDEVRETVAGVLSRLLQQEVSLICVLRGEIPMYGSPQSHAVNAPVSDGEVAGPETDDEERTRLRIQAAKNIFDAEEIGETVPASTVGLDEA